MSSVGGYKTSLEFSASLHTSIPWSWGKLVYREETSKVTNKLLGGMLCKFCNLQRKSLASFMKEGIHLTNGLRW